MEKMNVKLERFGDATEPLHEYKRIPRYVLIQSLSDLKQYHSLNPHLSLNSSKHLCPAHCPLYLIGITSLCTWSMGVECNSTGMNHPTRQSPTQLNRFGPTLIRRKNLSTFTGPRMGERWIKAPVRHLPYWNVSRETRTHGCVLCCTQRQRRKLPALVHFHGGGQRAFLHEVEFMQSEVMRAYQ